ncbi:MAG: hypothetical protein K6F53_10535 [Lachnospiraceae bacterium]|nr:hypothetical protein [Lachnospiraceae bacterium]
MSTIEKETGIKYRVLEDELTKTWKECSFTGIAEDITCNDGITVEEKLRNFRGISTTKQAITGYALDASVAGFAPTILSGTLYAGETDRSFTDSAISDDSIIQVATEIYGVSPVSVTQTGTTITIVFPKQANDLKFKVIIS